MPQAAITDRSPQSPPYKRHRPGQTLFYQIIERYLELIVLGRSIGLAKGYFKQVELWQLNFPELFREPILTASLNNSVLIGSLVHF